MKTYNVDDLILADSFETVTDQNYYFGKTYSELQNNIDNNKFSSVREYCPVIKEFFMESDDFAKILLPVNCVIERCAKRPFRSIKELHSLVCQNEKILSETDYLDEIRKTQFSIRLVTNKDFILKYTIKTIIHNEHVILLDNVSNEEFFKSFELKYKNVWIPFGI